MHSALTEFGGEEQFTVQPALLFGVLTDLDVITALIPNVESARRVDPQTIECVTRPGFSFLRGTLKLQVRMAEVVPPERATMQISAQGIGVSVRLESRLEVAAHSFGSLLKWRADILEMKGLIATVSPGLVRAAADQVIRHAWQRVHERVDP